MSMRKQLIAMGLALLFMLIGTGIVILYGQGYRFGFDNGKIGLSGTGMLVATSNPDGAQVFINGHLTTATNNTINLFPGDYTVKIVKEGYFPWEKMITVQKEVVSKAEALLLPQAPKLESLTTNGVATPTIDPSGSRLAFVVASQSARKNGIYILDMTNRPVITLSSSSLQIADDTVDFFSRAHLSWSPDGKQILASISGTPENTTYYLLEANGLNNNPQDITATLLSVQAQWEKDQKDLDAARLSTFKPELRKFINSNFTILWWAPDETRILYTASKSATIPIIIKPRLIGSNSTSEEREIKEGNIYVYDVKEDKNYSLKIKPEEHTWVSWFSDSRHIIYVHDKKIDLLEYDGTNKTTIYAGPFMPEYVFPWQNTTKVVILTNLGNEDSPANLYTIGLK